MARVGSVVALGAASPIVTLPATNLPRVGITGTGNVLVGSFQANPAETLVTTTDSGGGYAAMVEGAAAREGTGPLTHLSGVGLVDNLTSVGATTAQRVLDDIGDGATYLRVTGVSAGHQAQAASLATGAVTAPKVADQVIDAQHIYQRHRIVLNPNPNFLRFR